MLSPDLKSIRSRHKVALALPETIAESPLGIPGEIPLHFPFPAKYKGDTQRRVGTHALTTTVKITKKTRLEQDTGPWIRKSASKAKELEERIEQTLALDSAMKNPLLPYLIVLSFRNTPGPSGCRKASSIPPPWSRRPLNPSTVYRTLALIKQNGRNHLLVPYTRH